MYLEAFGFREAPFGVTPDPHFLYLGRTHEQALSSLRYGIEHRQGFVMVTGEVGTGKTLLCRVLLDRLAQGTSTALILNPRLEPLELLRVIVSDFGLAVAPDGSADLIESLNRFLLAKLRSGEHVVLVIDEAQTLPDQSLEQIRLLSNLETDREKLLQIVLVGQPELLAKLGQSQLRQVNQRITVRCTLKPLQPREIRRYVAHRLQVASGRPRADLFTAAGLRAVSLLSRGYPREINALCDRALLAAYAAAGARIGIRLVARAYRDLHRAPPRSWGRLSALLRWAVPALLLACAVVFAVRNGYPGKPIPSSADTSPRAAGTSSQPAIAAQPQQQPSRTPPQPPSATQPTVDEIPSDSASLSASLAAIATRWRKERLADEARQWRFVNVKDRSLPVFFEKSGLAKSSGMELVALPATRSTLAAANLPCLASERTGAGFRFVVLSGVKNAKAEILDPVAGRRIVPLEEWLANVRGAFYVLAPEGTFSAPARLGDRGPAVLALQRALQRAGVLRGVPNGVYGQQTREAAIRFQRGHGIAADGAVGPQTRLALLRLGGATVPALQETP